MGLDELVKDKGGDTSSTKSKTKKKSKSKKKKDKPVGGQKTINRTKASDKRPSEVHVREDRSDIDCLNCKDCSRGTKAPVIGVAEDPEGRVDFGSLQFCDNIFCDDSIFHVEDPPLDFDRLKVHKEIVKATGGPGMGSW